MAKKWGARIRTRTLKRGEKNAQKAILNSKKSIYVQERTLKASMSDKQRKKLVHLNRVVYRSDKQRQRASHNSEVLLFKGGVGVGEAKKK